MPPLVVAEAGLAHNGSVERALDLVEAARDAGADIVKFQTYQVDKLLRRSDPDYDLLERLALPLKDFATIASHCDAVGIEFCSTPGDIDSLEYLVNQCRVRRIKIGSDDLTNDKLLRRAYFTGLPVILSTGMATANEIQGALPVNADSSDSMVTLMQCVSLYPCPPEKVNLRAMEALRFFKLPVGYSDHTTGTIACIAAAALGAVIIEKHIMLGGTQPVDTAVSIVPMRFKSMVERIHEVSLMLGDGLKVPTDEELAMAQKLRKGPDGLRGIC